LVAKFLEWFQVGSQFVAGAGFFGIKVFAEDSEVGVDGDHSARWGSFVLGPEFWMHGME